MKTVALIDGDIIAYEIAVGAQLVINWADEGEPDLYTASMNGDEVRARLVGACTKIANDVGADSWQVCLTGKGNWRKDILPTYKGNRVYASKPIFLDAVKDLAREHLDAYHWEGFEADDMLGFLATDSAHFGNDRAIICSIDKDLRCVPGLHWNWQRNVAGRKQEGLVEVSQEEADRFHLYQTLIGDTTDNYTGLPGCGPKTAEKILNASCTWSAVVEAYEAKDLTEEDALIQARVARILRAGEIDMENMEPILWTTVNAEPIERVERRAADPDQVIAKPERRHARRGSPPVCFERQELEAATVAGTVVHVIDEDYRYALTPAAYAEACKILGATPAGATGYPDANPKTAAGAKKPDLSLIPPSAKLHLAAAMMEGAKKYGAYNWRDNAVNIRTYLAAAERHLGQFLDGEDFDPQSGAHHLGHVMACAAIVLDCIEQGNVVDNRPAKGQSGALIRRFDETGSMAA